MKKRIFAVLLVLVMALCLTTGCSKDEPSNVSLDGEGGTLFEEPVELTVMMSIDENNGADNKIIDKMFEMTNVKVNLIKAPISSYTEKLNVTLASGNLPDIVYINDAQVDSWVDEGALLPLDDLIDKYAQNFKKVFTEDVKKNIVNINDGHVYGMPYMLRLPVQNTMGVRRDWLETLGLSAPKTIDELETVLTAFKNNEDKLNGGAKIIPMAGKLSSMYAMFGITESGENQLWTLDEDGNYISIFEHPNYRECLETLNRFYSKGLIDPEYQSRNTDDTAIYTLFNSGTAGMGFVYSTRLKEITGILQQTNENAFFDYMEPIEGLDGKKRVLGRKQTGTQGCITIAAEGKEEACVRFLDWAYSEEGERLFNYGIEDLTYDMVDGKPIIKDEYNDGWVEIRKVGCVPTTISYNRSLDAYNQCMFNGKNIEDLNEFEKLTYKAYYENEKYVVPHVRAFSTKTSREKGTEIYAFLKEKQAKAITGTISIDQFFEELKKAKKNGLDTITKEMQEYWKKIN